MKKTVFLLIFLSLGIIFTAYTPEPKEEDVESVAPKQVGGLLFDFDEGVDIEQGPGGSVYVKSNREYMQKKLREIDKRFEDMAARIEQLESRAGILREGAEESVDETDPANERRVLTT